MNKKITENNKDINQKKNKKISFIPKDSTELLLIIVFIALMILTIFLGFRLHSVKKDLLEHVRANIVIPVFGQNTNNEISIDISNMQKNEEKKYIFKVSNNKEKIVNTIQVNYNLEFINNKNISFELYKNNDTEKLQLENYKLINNTLFANVEQEDTYILKIKALKKTKDAELLTIRVTS